MNRWGKAGVRLTDQEAAHRARTAVANRNRRAIADDDHLRIAYRLWRAGEVKPYMITRVLDSHGLHGPEVDDACGAREPDVDLWEAGKLYPTWRQLRLLAEVTGTTPRFLCTARELLTVDQTSLRFHGHADNGPPPVWTFEREAVLAAVADAPFEMPEEAS